ncbi:C-X-C motif chemokine 9 [Sorex araneus]|uniref:C-X-C motif chemokine 9 n=1 Tax=Sorex araneus TaxID=42254 RepID=UPI002433F693|nr:C-X-C motif chemokine 9 [Sorex araneus]
MKRSGSLLLGIIILTVVSVRGTPLMRSERCSCINTSSKTMKISSIKSLETFDPSSFCDKTEIIVVMKNGSETCLNPDSAKVKKLIKQWEKKSNQKKRQMKGKKSSKTRKVQKRRKSQQRHQKKST